MTINKHHRRILSIAVPSIVSNITVPLLGLIDIAIVGHLGNVSYIGAIAVGSMIFNLVYWIFGFLRMGASGMTSQALGSRNLTEVVRLLLRSLAVSLAIALLLIILQTPLQKIMFALIQPTADIAPLSSTYYYIVIWGAPAMLGLYGLTGWYIGMQNTRIPMLVSIIQNITNIIASLTLVAGLGMGFRGVAFGTVIAQYTGFFVALALLLRYYGRLGKYIELGGLFARSAMTRFFSVNGDIFMRTLFLVAVNLFFTSAGARQGAVILAVNTVLMQLYLLFSYFMDGFAYAGEAICGHYYGAGNNAAVRATVRRLFLWGAVVVAVFTAVYALGGEGFLHLLTDDNTVIAASGEYFPWALAVPLAGVAAFVWDGVFIGLTATRGMLVSSVIAAVAFFSTYFLLQPSLGNHALWLAQIIYLSMRGIIQSVIFRRRQHQRHQRRQE
ncbi:MAG: MATE family efflux transporter [Prevotella sp.]|nr:MATE family efflux transporter [Prevotella sp.]